MHGGQVSDLRLVFENNELERTPLISPAHSPIGAYIPRAIRPKKNIYESDSQGRNRTHTRSAALIGRGRSNSSKGTVGARKPLFLWLRRRGGARNRKGASNYCMRGGLGRATRPLGRGRGGGGHSPSWIVWGILWQDASLVSVPPAHVGPSQKNPAPRIPLSLLSNTFWPILIILPRSPVPFLLFLSLPGHEKGDIDSRLHSLSPLEGIAEEIKPEASWKQLLAQDH